MDIVNDIFLKYTIVVGNGFDLDLGFKTKYSDFVESVEWKTMYDERSSKSQSYSLLQYLNGKRYTEEWFDIESALIDYVSKKKDGSFVDNLAEDREDYDIVCNTLANYLDSHVTRKSHDISQTCAGRLLRNMCLDSDWEYKRFYTFNFTPINLYCSALGSIHSPKINYVHGKIENRSHILGIETKNISEIAPGYSFLIKSNNSAYKSSFLPFDLMKSKNVVFFGHSFNCIDFGYFEEYFKMMENTPDANKGIFIITYDEMTKQQLFDNLRLSGISVQKLFTHSHVEVIRTKDIYQEKKSDTETFEKLLSNIF